MTFIMAAVPLLAFFLLSLLCPTSADYSVVSITQQPYGWEGTLKLTSPGPYGQDISSLSLSVWFETPNRLRVTLRDAQAKRWEIPAEMLSIPSLSPPRRAPDTPHYNFSITTAPFGFAITRRSTGRTLFNTTLQPLHYSPQFLQVGTSLQPGGALYGLGERIIPFKLPVEDYVIWDNDWGNPTLKNLYGHHPVYFSTEPGGTAHAVVFWNSNMMDVNLSSSALTYKTIGGVLDFYFLMGPTPLELSEQYTEMVGRPWMPPVWALGWHQCKWGYVSANYTLQVVQNYSAAGIPLDTIWNDIDWMRDYVAFTYNDELGSHGYTVADVRAMNEYLVAHHQHHVQIVDPNIPAILEDKDKAPYLPYTLGKEAGIFVRHPANDTLLYGKQWPPMTVAWPDWTNPAVVDWWTANFRRFFDPGRPPVRRLARHERAVVFLSRTDFRHLYRGQGDGPCHRPPGRPPPGRLLAYGFAVPAVPAGQAVAGDGGSLVQYFFSSLPGSALQREGLLGDVRAARHPSCHGAPHSPPRLHPQSLHLHGLWQVGRPLAR